VVEDVEDENRATCWHLESFRRGLATAEAPAARAFATATEYTKRIIRNERAVYGPQRPHVRDVSPGRTLFATDHDESDLKAAPRRANCQSITAGGNNKVRPGSGPRQSLLVSRCVSWSDFPSHHENEEIHRDDRPASPYSSIVLDGPNAPPRARCFIRLASSPRIFKNAHRDCFTWGQVTPCNMHIDKLALEAEAGANDGGGKGMIFNTITISTAFRWAAKG